MNKNTIHELSDAMHGKRVMNMASGDPISSAELLKALGVYTGVSPLYVAFMTKEGTMGTLPTYDTPVLAAELIEIGLTPELASGTLNASDNAVRDTSIVTSYGVRVNAARLTPAMRQKLSGRLVTDDGLEVVGDSTEGPLVAIGYAANRDDWSKQMRWLLKGRFHEQTITDRTRERGSVAYVTPVLEGTFTPLDTVCKIGDKETHPILVEADTSTGGSTITEAAFFASVQMPPISNQAG